MQDLPMDELEELEDEPQVIESNSESNPEELKMVDKGLPHFDDGDDTGDFTNTNTYMDLDGC